MTSHAKPSPAVWLGLILTVISDCWVQLIWKELAITLPDPLTPLLMLEVMGTLPSVWLLAGLFMFKFVLWLWVLARTELSFAQPVTSLSYVGVALISAFVLRESWHWQNFASVILILVGVKLVSDSQGDEAT